MTQKSKCLNDVAIVTVWIHDYEVHFWSMSKSEDAKRIRKTDLRQKSGQLWLWQKRKSEEKNMLKRKYAKNW